MSLWEIMEELPAEDILAAIPLCTSYHTRWDSQGLEKPQELWPDTFRLIEDRIVRLEAALTDMDTPVTLRSVRELLHALRCAPQSDSGSKILSGQLLASATFSMGQIAQVIGVELGEKLFIKLRGSNKELFDQEYGLFGDEVDDAFPDAIEDISEAGKCIALERYTAAVFHLMRAMEDGVRVLATKLGATVENKHGETLPWGILTANIKEKIDELPSGRKKDDWLVLHSLLHSANRAYRTKTAHPATNYNEKQAIAAYHATKSFLSEMADFILAD